MHSHINAFKIMDYINIFIKLIFVNNTNNMLS